jgi:hypothetical protein
MMASGITLISQRDVALVCRAARRAIGWSDPGLG